MLDRNAAHLRHKAVSLSLHFTLKVVQVVERSLDEEPPRWMKNPHKHWSLWVLHPCSALLYPNQELEFLLEVSGSFLFSRSGTS